MVHKIIISIILFFTFSSAASAQSDADTRAYIAQYTQLALEQQKIYGIPAPITLAQGILESGSGKSGLTRSSNNHFGVKASSNWGGGIHHAWDDEPQKSRFRVYASARASYEDHSKVLKEKRYASLYNYSIYDYRNWAFGLKAAGYATSPTYATSLIGIIDRFALYKINGGVKLQPGKKVTIVEYRTVENADVPVFDEECVMEETIESEEQEELESAIQKFVVEINKVRCTILYPGESLASISRKYDISKYKILECNEVANENNIHDGDIVYLAKKKKNYTGVHDRHTVRKGESLYTISQQYGIKMACLAKKNGKDIFTKLQEGEILLLK